jgi:hypothetical protein
VVFYVDVKNVGEATEFYKLEIRGPVFLLQ